MKKYKVKVNEKVFEVLVESCDEVDGHIEKAVQEEKVVSSGSNKILAPIAGKVVDLKVNVGDVVKVNQTVAIIEAMKLENEIQSPFNGKVAQILVNKGNDVKNKDVLIVLE